MFVNTLTVDIKHSLLNRDNLTRPIRTQLSQKQKAFSQFFLAFSKFTLNFDHFQTKDDPHSWFFPEIRNSEKCAYIYVQKVPFQRILWQATWETSWNTVAMWTTELLKYLLIILKVVLSEKVGFSQMQSLITVCWTIDCWWQVFSS